MENFILNNLYLFYDERNGIHGICFGKTLEEAKENARYYLSVKFDDISDQKGLEEKFKKKGIIPSILLPTGIPVSSRFINEAKNIKKDYNIKNEKVILVMLGSMGFGNIKDILDDILKEDNIKVLVVCGSNKKLLEELKTINNDKLIPLGSPKRVLPIKRTPSKSKT